MTRREFQMALQGLADAVYENMRDCMDLSADPGLGGECGKDIAAISRVFKVAEEYVTDPTDGMDLHVGGALQ
jgi:hypothetical protein